MTPTLISNNKTDFIIQETLKKIYRANGFLIFIKNLCFQE